MVSLNIVAHPDDDLLFLNPDILQEVEQGEWPWILYLTYGDDGDPSVWRTKAAASRKAWGDNFNLLWLNLRSNSFKNGNAYGDLYQMFIDPNYVAHSIFSMSMDRELLIQELQRYISIIQPTVIRTHDPDTLPAIDHSEPQLDHIDHIYTAKFVQEAAKGFVMIPVFAYEGYPIRAKAANVSPELAAKKQVMWRAYQSIDLSVAGEIWDDATPRCYSRQIQ